MQKKDTQSSNPKETIANDIDLGKLAEDIQTWALELGFQQVGISNTQLDDAQTHLLNWLQSGYQGSMSYMSRHGSKRYIPGELVPGTISIISARMNYLPQSSDDSLKLLKQADTAYIARYALGRDYHKLMRNRLKKLAEKIRSTIGSCSYRVFTDSAPVMEKAIAEKAGIGWIGKHSNLINKNAGSWFFLGEIYTDIALPLNSAVNNHCGDCTACIDNCPTDAIVAPYQVDARRCISYLTIENRESIPLELRPLMKNRIYGCDDCQLYCPWNRFEKITEENDYHPRHNLDSATLLELFLWSEQDFDVRTTGSPIRRIGYECWLRNIAVALGNANYDDEIVNALQQRVTHPSLLVTEHVRWALEQQLKKQIN